MLDLDETLFVEHKAGLGGDSHQLGATVGAFANTLGGWLLLGVERGKLVRDTSSWHSELPLVDVVRDRLRGLLDPFPAFEARTVLLDEGPVGVVRVYESTDTPHISVRTGAIYVREPAGVQDLNRERVPGAGAHANRVYTASQIRSQAQLAELMARGQRARSRVETLLAPGQQLPLIKDGLGLSIAADANGFLMPSDRGSADIWVRLAPYTLPARYQRWATTATAAGALLGTAEEITQRRGFAQNWIHPHPAGMYTVMGAGASQPRHTDGAGMQLDNEVRLAIDQAGVVGAGMLLAPPEQELRRTWMDMDTIGSQLVLPVVSAAARLLDEGEFLGRTRCQIDLARLGRALMVEHSDGNSAAYVPITTDLNIPAAPTELDAVARLAARAFARSSGLPAWDEPSPTTS